MASSEIRAGDQTSSVVALGNVTGMSFPVVAGTIYRFRFDIVHRTAATTTGIGLGLTVPAFDTFAATVRLPVAADGVGGEMQGWLTSSGDSVVGTGIPVANADHLATIDGIILPSQAGTVQLQFRSEVAGSLVTIRNGSLITV